MFSTDFIFRQDENLVDNQKCQAWFRPLCNKILLCNLNSSKINLPLFLLKHILLSIAWNLIVVGSILYELIQCVKGICIHFLIYLVINFVSLIQKHTIISKRKHLLHFTTKVLLIKVLWWVGYFYSTEFESWTGCAV